MGKEGQLYGDRGKQIFGGEHAVVYADVTLYCTLETYTMLYQCDLKKGKKRFPGELIA